MRILFERCAGLDVHKKTVVPCRTRPGAGGERERELRTFGTMTADLLQLVDWLHEWGVTHVAMESTGDYWRPIFNLLEGEFEVWLVNPQHLKRVPGRKTDAKDAEWLCECLELGLLQPSFVPPQPQRDLRELTRYRTTLVQERARVVNRIQKLLEGANIKLASVAADVLGVSGRAMLEALVAGQTDASAMAELARGTLRNKRSQLAQALRGHVRPPQRFLLNQQLAHIDFLDTQIAALGQEITHLMETVPPDPPSDSAPSTTAGGEATPDSPAPGPDSPLPPLAAVALLDTIPGVDQCLAEIIVSELGTDMRRFPSAAHAAAWAGLAPGNYESGGKRYSGRIRSGNQALRTALVQGAWAASHTKNTYLAAQYYRLVGRRGKKRALIAVAHSILVIAYHMLLRHEPFRELGGSYFDERKKDAVTNHLLKRLEKLGYAVQIEPLPMAA
jgi:transposase